MYRGYRERRSWTFFPLSVLCTLEVECLLYLSLNIFRYRDIIMLFYCSVIGQESFPPLFWLSVNLNGVCVCELWMVCVCVWTSNGVCVCVWTLNGLCVCELRMVCLNFEWCVCVHLRRTYLNYILYGKYCNHVVYVNITLTSRLLNILFFSQHWQPHWDLTFFCLDRLSVIISYLTE